MKSFNSSLSSRIEIIDRNFQSVEVPASHWLLELNQIWIRYGFALKKFDTLEEFSYERFPNFGGSTSTAATPANSQTPSLGKKREWRGKCLWRMLTECVYFKAYKWHLILHNVTFPCINAMPCLWLVAGEVERTGRVCSDNNDNLWPFYSHFYLSLVSRSAGPSVSI